MTLVRIAIVLGAFVVATAAQPSVAHRATTCTGNSTGALDTGSVDASFSCSPPQTNVLPQLYGAESITTGTSRGITVTFHTTALASCTEFAGAQVVVAPDAKTDLQISTGSTWCRKLSGNKLSGNKVRIRAGTRNITISGDPVFGIDVQPDGGIGVKVYAGSPLAVSIDGAATTVPVSPNQQLIIPVGGLPRVSLVKSLQLTPAEQMITACLEHNLVLASPLQAADWLTAHNQSSVVAIGQPVQSTSQVRVVRPALTQFTQSVKSQNPNISVQRMSSTQTGGSALADKLRQSNAKTVVLSGDFSALSGSFGQIQSAAAASGAAVLFVPNPPSIASLSKSSGAVGDTVTINGSHLTGVSAVTFNGVPANITASTDSTITVTVPTGATSGPVTVTTYAGPASSSAFTVATPPPPPPTISQVPQFVRVGDSMTITGAHFTGLTSVAFLGGVNATISNSTDSSITVIVPAGAASGPITVTTSGGSATSSSSVTVLRTLHYGPNTCKAGYVWREADQSDWVCVTPQVRAQTRYENAQASARRNPGGGAYGPDTCRQGYVWRDAFPGDHICVTPQSRQQAQNDNSQAESRLLQA
jgi:large repetitive protein